MSSRSRRSTRSTRSTTPSSPPAWRSGSAPKQTAQASLSYVIAEPQQGAPLASATSRLPSPYPRPTEASASTNSNPASAPPLSPEDMDEGIGGIFEPADPATTQQSPQPDTITTHDTVNENPEPPSSQTAATNPDLPHPNAKNQETLKSTTASIAPSESNKSLKSTVRKVSWFSSLTRGKGKKKETKAPAIPFPSSEQPEPPESPQTLPAANSTEPVADAPSPSSTIPVAQPQPVEIPAPASSSGTQDAEPQEPATNVVAPSSLPRDIPLAQSPSKRSWFSSAPKQNVPSATPITSAPSSIPSSIDEVVPPITTITEPPTSPSPPAIVSSSSANSDAGTPRQRLSSLNPSTSRFMLNVPLLGRAKSNPSLPAANPKTPIDAAANGVSIVVDEAVQSEVKGPEESNQEQLDSSNNQSEPSEVPAHFSGTASQQDGIVATSSWWTYIGWNDRPSSAPPSVQENPPTSSSDLSKLQTSLPAASDSAPALVPATRDQNQSSSTPVGPNASAGTNSPAQPHPSEPGLNGGKSSSPTEPVSQETIKGNQAVPSLVADGKGDGAKGEDGARSLPTAHDHDTLEPSASTWYNPWTWYPEPSSSAPNIEPPKVGQAETSEAVVGSMSQDVHSETSKASGRTEATTLNANTATSGTASNNGGNDAVATEQKGGDSPSQPAHASLDHDQSLGRQSLVSNPIENTLGTNRSAWASFFSSKSLLVKTITGAPEVKRDENGMEVMDIDDDEDGEKPPMDATPKDIHQRGRDDQAKNEVGTVQNGKQMPPLSKSEDRSVPSNTPSGQQSPTKSTTDKKASEVTSSRHKPVAPPLTISESVKRETTKQDPANQRKAPSKQVETTKSSSPARSTKSGRSSRPRSPPPPNLVLPTWQDTFHTAPRNYVPPPPVSKFTKTMQFVSGVLFASEKNASTPSTLDGRGARGSRDKGKARETDFAHFGRELPRALDVMGEKFDPDILRGCRRVVVIGIHGWFPGAIMRTVLGEPTGTSQKFVNMMVQALEEFQNDHDVRLEKITKVPLEGEGTIDSRVEKLYSNLKANDDWMTDIHAADAILVATHSQGSVVSTHLLDCLIRDKHIRTALNTVEDVVAEPTLPTAGLTSARPRQPQRVCCLALCGIHLGPLRYLSTSTILQPYLQYFESVAARELFEFQNTESEVSKKYVAALRRVLGNGTKMVYVASLNDQVVPIYSGIFTAASHPLILRALYIDGDAYHSSDFLSNLLTLLLRILNSGISDSGLLAHLSEATAGSLSGVGHSTAYEELATYSLAVKYLFLTNDGLTDHPDLALESFNANTEQNDYEIPWALRDIIADERVAYYFSQEITQLRDAFRDWQPRTTILRDLKRKLQPIQRLPSSFTSSSSASRL